MHGRYATNCKPKNRSKSRTDLSLCHSRHPQGTCHMPYSGTYPAVETHTNSLYWHYPSARNLLHSNGQKTHATASIHHKCTASSGQSITTTQGQYHSLTSKLSQFTSRRSHRYAYQWCPRGHHSENGQMELRYVPHLHSGPAVSFLCQHCNCDEHRVPNVHSTHTNSPFDILIILDKALHTYTATFIYSISATKTS